MLRFNTWITQQWLSYQFAPTIRRSLDDIMHGASTIIFNNNDNNPEDMTTIVKNNLKSVCLERIFFQYSIYVKSK